MFIFSSLLIAAIQGQECGLKGTCSNGSISDGNFQEDSFINCQAECQNVTGCSYFTYCQASTTCFLYSTCLNITNVGTDCYTSEPTCEALVCNEPGYCIGSAFQINITDSYDECLIECKAVEQCEWIVYESENKFCSLRDSCELSNTCPTCVVGQKQCQVEIPSGKVV